MPIGQTRRRFLTTASMAGGTILLGAPPAPAAEGPLETTTLRFSKLERNPKVSPNEFRFDPPKGADVLGDK